MEKEQRLIHVCELCGKTKIMTPEQAFNEGWDYPPRMGAFGIVSPRTCGDCSMMDTLWMALQSGNGFKCGYSPEWQGWEQSSCSYQPTYW